MRLVPEPIEGVDDFHPLVGGVAEHSLNHQPQRPGELCDWLEMSLSKNAAVYLQASATVPVSLWAAIAIEGLRLAEELGPLFGRELTECLDEAAEARVGPAIGRDAARSLGSYAASLRAGEGIDGSGNIEAGPMVLTPSISVATAWEQHARRCGLSLGQWLYGALESRPAGRISWEAAAAERGDSMAAWAAQIALRHMRR